MSSYMDIQPSFQCWFHKLARLLNIMLCIIFNTSMKLSTNSTCACWFTLIFACTFWCNFDFDKNIFFFIIFFFALFIFLDSLILWVFFFFLFPSLFLFISHETLASLTFCLRVRYWEWTKRCISSRFEVKASVAKCLSSAVFYIFWSKWWQSTVSRII